jgi:rhomboid protease GluP
MRETARLSYEPGPPILTWISAGTTPGFPVRLALPPTRPLVTYTLIAACVVIYLLQIASQAVYGFDVIAALGAKVNPLIARGQFWRLFTPMFLHASILHIGFNMYALYNFGPSLERHYGHGRFLALYVLGGFAGNVLSFVFSPAVSLGASTAIFGLLGAEGAFFYQNRRFFGSVGQRVLMNLLVIGMVNLVIGFTPGSSIDNWGHIGGLIGGTLFAWFAGPLLKVEGTYPALALVDGRESRQVIITGLLDGGFFALLTGLTIFWRT